MSTSIKCKDLEKSYKGDGVETHALQGINLSFNKGEFTAIVGPSGSGKSTLLSLIGTLDQPSSGNISYDGKKLASMKQKQIADFRFEHIGFVFQQFHLLPTLTSLENVMAPLFSRKVPYNKKERAQEVLKQVGLEDKENSLPSQLSGGQQQRVAIARALVHEPDWLLADEATGNLDTESGEVIFDIIQRLNSEKNCGVLFVTHDHDLASRANRVIKMKDGSVVSSLVER
ncbi:MULTISPECIES: ABC transporter ATP-binding protein [Virgibacillus]|uniref:Putative ABC transport system ATP-binding protein/lipoprotein-releasing system ATP-binding protein n=1 Tax=Virgibacillus salinus TaxID=553311 RepID=A0A1H1FPD1_9BACI|nr:ABC transporter ATP-binding protein [Virgibacillus salinus]SDR02745.1 putative ABC transport system ATP-binding protein/lipoprotein-releasing system ATP-binding protein [Virgibacillus salinus]